MVNLQCISSFSVFSLIYLFISGSRFSIILFASLCPCFQQCSLAAIKQARSVSWLVSLLFSQSVSKLVSLFV